jgi:SH3-like domain-containing protein
MRISPLRNVVRLFLCTVTLALAAPAWAANGEEGGLPVPRFVSLKSNEVNLRAGPGQRYPIEWVYKRPGYPVEITAESDLWRQIRDIDGTTGWVYHSLLAAKRTALVTGGVRTLRNEPSEEAEGVALAEPGVMVELRVCEGEWCEVDARGIVGWIKRTELWGVYAKEEIR